MTIRNPKTGEQMHTPCDGGCYCHGLPVVVDGDVHGDVCGCGCPKTLAGWQQCVGKSGYRVVGGDHEET